MKVLVLHVAITSLCLFSRLLVYSDEEWQKGRIKEGRWGLRLEEQEVLIYEGRYMSKASV